MAMVTPILCTQAKGQEMHWQYALAMAKRSTAHTFIQCFA